MVMEEKNQHLSTESSKSPPTRGTRKVLSRQLPRQERGGAEGKRPPRREKEQGHRAGRARETANTVGRSVTQEAGVAGEENRVRPGPQKSRLQDSVNHARVLSQETSVRKRG